MRFNTRTIALLAVACSITLPGCTAEQTAPKAAQRLACSTVWGNTSCWTSLVAIAAAPTRFHDVPVIVEGWMGLHRDKLALFPTESAGQPLESWLSVLLIGEHALLQEACTRHCYGPVQVRGRFIAGDNESSGGPRLGLIEIESIAPVKPIAFDTANTVVPAQDGMAAEARTAGIAGRSSEAATLR